ncbi:hypothetical protein R1sor_021207 [Riccia sorocarpa]|uniref:Uncharacterized protein n=1 Tax=Riccia sorocarpa TaxID=122646 RepID=A0ABD3GK24_9MARC
MSELYESGSGIENSSQPQMRKPEDNTEAHQDGAMLGQKAVVSSDSKEGAKPAANHAEEGHHDVHTTWSVQEKTEVHPPKKQNPFV